jgi:hypothetical protein
LEADVTLPQDCASDEWLAVQAEALREHGFGKVLQKVQKRIRFETKRADQAEQHMQTIGKIGQVPSGLYCDGCGFKDHERCVFFRKETGYDKELELATRLKDCVRFFK